MCLCGIEKKLKKLLAISEDAAGLLSDMDGKMDDVLARLALIETKLARFEPLGVQLMAVSQEVQDLATAVQGIVTQAQQNTTDILAAINRINTGGLSQADKDAVNAAKTAAQGTVQALADADTQLEAALNPPPP